MNRPLFAKQPAELDFAPPGAGFIAPAMSRHHGRDRVRQPPAAIDTLGEWRALPRRRPSRWRPILVIAAALAGAVALGMLTGCTSPHGPEMLPGTMPLPDGSRLAAFDAISRPDKWGLSATDGVGLLRIGPDGHTTVEGWSTTQGPSDAGMIAQAAISGAVSLGGSGIVASATRQGLDQVSKSISSMKPPAVQVDLPKSAAGL